MSPSYSLVAPQGGRRIYICRSFFQSALTGRVYMETSALPLLVVLLLPWPVFGSACSVSYSGNHKDLWEPMAKLVLEASYEATLWIAVLSALRNPDRAASFPSPTPWSPPVTFRLQGNKVTLNYSSLSIICLQTNNGWHGSFQFQPGV